MARRRRSSKLSTVFPILFLLVSALSESSSSPSPDDDSIINGEDRWVTWYRSLLTLQRKSKNQIPNCGEKGSRSQCLQNPKCRWCRSEALDDMCFSKAEAWRLPQQSVQTLKQMLGEKVQSATCLMTCGRKCGNLAY